MKTVINRLRAAMRISAESREVWRLIVFSALVGVLAGYGAIGFYRLMGWTTTLLTEGLAGYVPSRAGARFLADGAQAASGPLRPWVWFFLPALGGLVGGWLVFRFAPEAEGHGTDAAIAAYHFKDGYIRARVPLIKGLASAITIGTGGSAGAEGPIVQIGAGLASILSRLFKLNPARSRILMAAGMAAGVGAVFRAPTAGALFAAEVLYRDMDLEFEVIIPCVVAAVMAYAVFTLHLGTQVLFVTHDLAFHGLRELAPYLLMGAVLAVGAYFFVWMFYGVRDAFARLRLPRAIKPMLGGLLVGCIGLYFPGVLGQSYGMVQRVLAQGTTLESLVEGVGFRFLLAVFLFKTLATAFSIGSGGSGGVFGPSLVAGAALGGACGLAAQRLFPGVPIQVGAFALVGMAGFFAAAANTPISTIIMVSELTGNYNLLVPSMWVSIFAYVLARRYSIYEHQLKNRLEAPVHQGSMMTAALRNVMVADALPPTPLGVIETVRPDSLLPALLDLFSRSNQSSVPVVDVKGEVVGIVFETRLRATIESASRKWRTLRAGDLTVEAIWVSPDDSLLEVLQVMAENGVEEVLVSERNSVHRARTILTHAAITTRYHEMLASAAGVGGEARDEHPPERETE